MYFIYLALSSWVISLWISALSSLIHLSADILRCQAYTLPLYLPTLSPESLYPSPLLLKSYLDILIVLWVALIVYILVVTYIETIKTFPFNEDLFLLKVLSAPPYPYLQDVTIETQKI